MTIDTLEQYRGIVSEIRALNALIETLYDTRKSPNGKDTAGHGSGPSAPTEQAFRRIDALKTKRDAKRGQWERAVQEIEAWLDTVEDADVRSIVRWRFIMGCSWKRTSREVYGVDNYYRARKKFLRYFEKI
jgi:hypothetical protein